MCQTLLGTRRQRQIIFGPFLEETRSGWGRHFKQTNREKCYGDCNSDVQIAIVTQKTLKSILNKDLKMKTSKRSNFFPKDE